MKPGRELDALIAEKVMGWRIFPDGPNGEMHTIDANQCECHEYDIPHYSTDIAAAWEVVEKLHNDNSFVTIEYGYYEENRKTFRVEVEWTDAEEIHQWRQTTEETAPHAICLAALKAVEGK